MAINAEVTKKFADAYYGPGNVIGDGELLKKLMEFFMGLIGGCPLGARRAHRLMNGGPLQKRQAENQIWWQAYRLTGDADEADQFVQVARKVGAASVEEYIDFAKA